MVTDLPLQRNIRDGFAPRNQWERYLHADVSTLDRSDILEDDNIRLALNYATNKNAISENQKFIYTYIVSSEATLNELK